MAKSSVSMSMAKKSIVSFIVAPSIKMLTPVYIGRDYQRFFNGKITEVQVWDKALTPDEIQKTMTHKLTGYEEDLVGYWPLDKGHGNVATDLKPLMMNMGSLLVLSGMSSSTYWY